MAKLIKNISTESLRGPIYDSVKRYSEIAGQKGLVFNPDDLQELTLTPDKPNTARTVIEARDHHGEKVGDMYVIAFKPQDGTGDSKSRRISDLDVKYPYFYVEALTPRDKALGSEVHLGILSQAAWEREPTPFGGQLDLIGLRGLSLGRLGTLGVGRSSSKNISTLGFSEPAQDLQPNASYTVKGEGLSREGDPHAAYNYTSELVVAAFLAVESHNAFLLQNAFNPRSPFNTER